MANNYGPLIGDIDAYLFFEGTHRYAYRFMGAHPLTDGAWHFALWAPHAQEVSVVGDFNGWDALSNPLARVHENGLWVGTVDNLSPGAYYQYAIQTPAGNRIFKSDPYAFSSAVRPNTASRLVAQEPYLWQDAAWIAQRRTRNHRLSPMSIYEIHLGSWRRGALNEFLNYREIADALVPYLVEMHYTHVELMPVMEHPLDDSWGYQVTGFYAVNSRHGSPDDFRYLVDKLHQAGISVLLDWVPAHFCKDAHGLRHFDGVPTYEYQDAIRGEHPHWGTSVFDYGKAEVVSFLMSAALYWIDAFHVDGLRFDAVSSMLYLDYGRDGGEWLPNKEGGRENFEAIELLRNINDAVHLEFPGCVTIAEESTAWPLVTQPPEAGGLGFDFKWDMGWMNDTLAYMKDDPIYHQYHQDMLTFSMMYAYNENFILPLSHDEVVHGKKTLLDKMPGDYWAKFASLRLLLGYQYAHPGKKLTFMGTEIAPFQEWRFYEGLEWHLLEYDMHAHTQKYMRELNAFYRAHPALWQRDDGWHGFTWLNPNDSEHSVISFIRAADEEELVVVCNFVPVTWEKYRIALPAAGHLFEVFNSDNGFYGGHCHTNAADIPTEEVPLMNQAYSACICAPALGMAIFQYKRDPVKPKRGARTRTGAKSAAAKPAAKRAAPRKSADAATKTAAKAAARKRSAPAKRQPAVKETKDTKSTRQGSVKDHD
nr:1,4-alpha-glucan branching protein GlgB [Maliibacterium massiliense]